MKLLRTGVILNTEKFDACVAFYRDVFGLDILFEDSDGDFRLACLDFHGSYLMIETGGTARPGGKPIPANAAQLRFNVDDIDRAAKKLKEFGIDTEIRRNAWGATIDFHDPDGNRIGIRDETTFRDQIET